MRVGSPTHFMVARLSFLTFLFFMFFFYGVKNVLGRLMERRWSNGAAGSSEYRHLQTLDCSSTDVLWHVFFSSPEEAEPEESEEPFVAPAGLVIPPDVELVSE